MQASHKDRSFFKPPKSCTLQKDPINSDQGISPRFLRDQCMRLADRNEKIGQQSVVSEGIQQAFTPSPSASAKFACGQ